MRAIYDEYSYTPDIFNEDDDGMNLLLAVTYEVTTQAERNLLFQYAEVASLRKLAPQIGVSHVKLRYCLQAINDKIKCEYHKYTDYNDFLMKKKT